MQLGYFPRVTIKHTAHDTEGQIYVPEINWALAVSCILLVLSFRASERLASAYGIAVTGTMGITSIVFGVVAISVLGWSAPATVALVAFFLAFDIPFFLANAAKFREGGWLPALIGVILTAIMLLWARGRRLMRDVFLASARPLSWLSEIPRSKAVRLEGTAVMLAASTGVVPPVLTQVVERFGVLHERIILLSVVTEARHRVPRAKRATIEDLGGGIHRATIRFGFMEDHDVPRALRRVLARAKIDFDPDQTTYFLRRENVIAGSGGQMSAFAERIFAFLHRNASSADQWFRLPASRVVELGWQLDL
jgi:KUP system potassium uptake protein